MRKSRVLTGIISGVLFVSGFGACAAPQDAPQTETSEGEKLRIVTTIFPQYDFAREIAGEYAEVSMLLKPGMESHSYEPTPRDIKVIQSSDLFIYVGGANDTWIEEILASMGEEKPDTLRLLDCVETVTEEIVEGMEHTHKDDVRHDHSQDHQDHHDDHQDHHDHHYEAEHGHSHGHHDHDKEAMDEHVWTSPRNAIEIVKTMTSIFSEKDAENAKIYAENSEAYIAKLEALDASFKEVVSAARVHIMIFGDRFPFRYFADAYGLTYFAAFTGCSTETEASAATVAFLIDKVKEEMISSVFVIEFSNGKIADSICEATGAKKLSMHSCHNLSKDEMEAGETYLSLMTKNVEALREALY